jgi:hypothetical protein
MDSCLKYLFVFVVLWFCVCVCICVCVCVYGTFCSFQMLLCDFVAKVWKLNCSTVVSLLK